MPIILLNFVSPSGNYILGNRLMNNCLYGCGLLKKMLFSVGERCTFS